MPVRRGSGRRTGPSAGRSPYGQRRPCRDERITERWNVPRRSIWSACPARRSARPAHGPSRAAAPLHAVRRGHRSDPGAARGTQPAGFRTAALRLPISGANSGGGGGHSPLNVLGFIAAQLGMGVEGLDGYAIREETRREHLAELRRIYGYRMFSGRSARDLKVWLDHEAEGAHSNEGLARRFVDECRRRQVILPGLSVLERLCADALVAAERRMEARIVAGLDDVLRIGLDRLLTEEVDGGVSRFVWLRRFEVGRNSADINSLLDRLEFLQSFDLPPTCWRPFRPIALPACVARGNAILPTGCVIFRVIAGSPSLPSAPWNGAALSPMPWSRPMTGSSARPSGVRSGTAMRAFRIRGQYYTIPCPGLGSARRCVPHVGAPALRQCATCDRHRLRPPPAFLAGPWQGRFWLP